MELDDLLKEEGLDAAGVESALAWARRRAAELLHDVGGDPELGPLLDGAGPVPASEASVRPVEPRPVEPAEPRPSAAEPVEARANDPEPAPAVPAAVESLAAPPHEPEPVAARSSEPALAGAPAPESAPAASLEPTPSESPESDPDAPVAPTRRSSTSQPAAAAAVSSTPPPMFKDLRGLQAAFLAEADERDEDIPPVGAVLRAFQKGRSGLHRAVPSDAPAPTEASRSTEPDHARPGELADADPEHHHARPGELADADRREPEASPSNAPAPIHDHGLPAPPEADLDPLAGIDFDDLPGVDEDDEEEDHTHVDLPSPSHAAAAAEGFEARTTMVPMDGPDLTLPSMQSPLTDLVRAHAEGTLPSGELTERALNPLLGAEPPAEPPREVTARAPNPLVTAIPEPPATPDLPAPPPTAASPEEPAEEIELLDDDDLLLVEEEPDDDEDDAEIPEWKRALLESAQLEREKAARGGAGEPGDD